MDTLPSNTAAHPGPLDPIRDCAPDELVFPLVARDPDAPAAIRHWADTRRKRITSLLVDGDVEPDDLESLKSDLRRCSAADEEADRFEAWRLGRDQGEAKLERATYGGEAKDDSERVAYSSAVQSIAKAAFHLRAALDGLTPAMDPDLVELAELHERVRALHLAKLERRAAYPGSAAP